MNVKGHIFKRVTHFKYLDIKRSQPSNRIDKNLKMEICSTYYRIQ